MKTLIKIAKSFKNSDLPTAQVKAITNLENSGLDGLVLSENLNNILHPCFSYHYLFVSGTCDSDTITTKSTTGESARWGKQSLTAEENAVCLAPIIAAILKKISKNKAGLPLVSGINEGAYYNGNRIVGVTNKLLNKFQ